MKLKIETYNPLFKIEFEGYDVDEIGRLLGALSEWEKSRAGTLGLELNTSSAGIDRLVDEGIPAPASSVVGQGGKFVSSFSPKDKE